MHVVYQVTTQTQNMSTSPCWPASTYLLFGVLTHYVEHNDAVSQVTDRNTCNEWIKRQLQSQRGIKRRKEKNLLGESRNAWRCSDLSARCTGLSVWSWLLLSHRQPPGWGWAAVVSVWNRSGCIWSPARCTVKTQMARISQIVLTAVSTVFSPENEALLPWCAHYGWSGGPSGLFPVHLKTQFDFCFL